MKLIFRPSDFLDVEQIADVIDYTKCAEIANIKIENLITAVKRVCRDRDLIHEDANRTLEKLQETLDKLEGKK